MNTYIALLRGINVGGQKIVLMDDLKKLLQKLECGEVRTYIQSGNVVFQHAQQRKTSDWAQGIERGIAQRFGFPVPVIVKTIGEWRDAVKKNPFSAEGLTGKERIYVSFFSGLPAAQRMQELHTAEDQGDELRLLNTEAYLLCRNGYNKTVFSNAFLEKQLGIVATTRNLETVKKLLDLGGGTAA